jgi:hypothetical protein
VLVFTPLICFALQSNALALSFQGFPRASERAVHASRRVITIHNNPDNLKLPSRFKHLRFQLADVDTQDVSRFFSPTYSFIEEGRAADEGAHKLTPGLS